MSEGFSRYSNYEYVPSPQAASETEPDMIPSPESVEAAEKALDLHAVLQSECPGCAEQMRNDQRMYELIELIQDPETKAVFEMKLHQARLADSQWVPPSQRTIV